MSIFAIFHSLIIDRYAAFSHIRNANDRIFLDFSSFLSIFQMFSLSDKTATNQIDLKSCDGVKKHDDNNESNK